MVIAVSFLIRLRYLGSQYQKQFGMIEQTPLMYLLLKVCGLEYYVVLGSYSF